MTVVKMVKNSVPEMLPRSDSTVNTTVRTIVTMLLTVSRFPSLFFNVSMLYPFLMGSSSTSSITVFKCPLPPSAL